MQTFWTYNGYFIKFDIHYNTLVVYLFVMAPCSNRSNFSKCLRAFLMLINVAADAKSESEI